LNNVGGFARGFYRDVEHRMHKGPRVCQRAS
jgi:hypothetical protein